MGKLIGLFLLTVFALNTTHVFEDCAPSVSHQESQSSVTADASHALAATTNGDSNSKDESSKSPSCPAGHCTNHCHAGHCHHLGIVTSVALLIDPSAGSLSVATQSSYSVVLQEDTRPPRV